MEFPFDQYWQMLQKTASAIAFTFLLKANPVMAVEATAPVTGAVSVSQIINLLAGLVVVLLTFFAIVFLLKRLSGMNGMNKGHMKIVDALHLGTKERLLIVKVTDKHILLGISPQGIHPLHVLTEDIVASSDEDGVQAQAPFNLLLSKMKFKEA